MSFKIGHAPSVVLEITVTCISLTQLTLDMNETPVSQPVMYSSRLRPASSPIYAVGVQANCYAALFH
jgi:hypothetical protein